MTPKEKADELRQIFLMRQTGEQEQFIAEHQALQCSIFHVENIIKEIQNVFVPKFAELNSTHIFWVEVLDELNYNNELNNLGDIFDNVFLLE